MEIKSVKLVYFSPTRTTQKILEGIVKGIAVDVIRHINLTVPESNPQSDEDQSQELFVFGAPVYGGRLPVEAVKRIKQIRGKGAPAAVVVVYGNRAFDDALLELRNLIMENGFIPVAGAAFIGEHSFATEKMPIANRRPDQKDLEKARCFGALISEKLREQSSPNGQPPLDIPGKFPYQKYNAPSNISPVTNTDLCSQCETCCDVCPTGAVRLIDEIETNTEACIVCCACVKNCPSGARTIEEPRIQKAAQWLSANFQERKEPEMFL
jgi:ferredoxin